MTVAVAHCLDTNVLLYAFSKTPRDAAKTRISREIGRAHV